MRKQIILKILVTNSLLVTSLLAGSLSSKEIEDMVEAIKQERKGISLAELESTVNPFIIKVPSKKEDGKDDKSAHVVVYRLKAILNKAAFIDKKWYKKGDQIGEYKIGHISDSSVVLLSTNGNKTLSLNKKKKNFIKLNRGRK